MPTSNPLFDPPQKKPQEDSKPQIQAEDDTNSPEAVALIRAKIGEIYNQEPDAKEEEQEAEVVKNRSKHQQFMYDLSISGKHLAEIQTAWHEYYTGLSDKEKHKVWQEFYQNQSKLSKFAKGTAVASKEPHHQPPKVSHAPHDAEKPVSKDEGNKNASVQELKQHLLKTVSKHTNVSKKRKHQLKSLGFGLSMGLLTMIVLLFGFFNERFIAPFITPSRTVSSTPIITDINNTEVIAGEPVVIVPKINIEIPVVYDEPSIDEGAVQRALERGVLHYPTTSNPGEQGNVVLFGHSSSNILNNGKYKFAFVLLNRLETGDTVMLQKDGKRYVYRVFEKKVVPPTDLSVLNSRDKPTVTLITCDPPGTATNRLIVTAEQISPDPNSNIASTAKPNEVATPQTLPSNAPSLWSRFWGWISS